MAVASVFKPLLETFRKREDERVLEGLASGEYFALLGRPFSGTSDYVQGPLLALEDTVLRGIIRQDDHWNAQEERY